MDAGYKIEIADNEEKYRGLRALWCEVFNDEPDFVDSMYECFGADIGAGRFASDEIKGYVAIAPGDEESKVASALTCFYSGEFEGRPTHTSYAICTRPDMRGLGLAGELVERVRDIVVGSGGISLISPAEPSLIDFYKKHAYEEHFYALQTYALLDDEELFEFDEADDEYDKFEPEFEMKALDAASYNKFREAFLTDRPHVELGDSFIKLIYGESMMADGTSGLYLINGGDAICALGEYPKGMPMILELLVNPVLAELSMEIDNEICRRIALKFKMDALAYRMPGPGACQTMAAGIETDDIDDDDDRYYYTSYEPYYGFPID